MSSLSVFHFLRPYWLLALLPLAWLFFRAVRAPMRSSGWQSIVDPALLPHVLAQQNQHSSRAHWLLAAAWTLAVIALAGPTWNQLPVAAYRAQDARVFVLDVSRSMDAADVQPSRLARAKLKLLDMLQQSRDEGAAMIAYAEHAYVVAPLTQDTRTIANLVPALSSDIMPEQGSRPDRALLKAAELIHQSGLAHGDIVWITDDGGDVMATRDTVRRLTQQRFRISILGVGTSEGAPIPLSTGGFVKDQHGTPVIPRLDEKSLRELADLGDGTYSALTPDDRDIAALLHANRRATTADREADRQNIGIWQDRGAYLVAALLPLAALGLRRGWLASLACLMVMQPTDAYALHWNELWSRPEQIGASKLTGDNPSDALEHFDDPMWRGTALYRARHYQAAADEFGKLQTADALYNRGNALAQLQQWRNAAAAYDAALKIDPHHADAQFNRKLIQSKIAQQNQNQDGAANASQSGDEKQNGNNDRPNDNRSSQNGTSDNKGGRTAAAQQDDRAGNSQSGTGGKNDTPQTHRSAADKQQATSGDGADHAEQREGPGDTAGQNSDATQPGDDQGIAANANSENQTQTREAREAREQWLRRVPDDPGGLLRRKFLRDRQREQENDATTSPDTTKKHTPW